MILVVTFQHKAICGVKNLSLISFDGNTGNVLYLVFRCGEMWVWLHDHLEGCDCTEGIYYRYIAKENLKKNHQTSNILLDRCTKGTRRQLDCNKGTRCQIYWQAKLHYASNIFSKTYIPNEIVQWVLGYRYIAKYIFWNDIRLQNVKMTRGIILPKKVSKGETGFS